MTNTTLETVTSADGTPIVIERRGTGVPVVLIGGAFNDRTTVAGLAEALAPERATVVHDRRGRGASGRTPDHRVEREVEDLAAVIEHVGGTADLFGHSSGGCLALEAVLRGLPVRGLAVYETPYRVEDSHPLPAADLGERVQALVAVDRRDDAAALFLTEMVGLPAEVLAGMRSDPGTWGWFRELAPSLPHDVALFGPRGSLPAPERLGAVTVPTLTISGGASDPWLQAGAAAVADAVPGARHVVLDGHDHGVLQQPAVLRPLLLEFFS